MTNPLLQYQHLQAFISETLREHGEGFWDYINGTFDDESRETIINAMGDPAAFLYPHQIMPMLDEQAWHRDPVDPYNPDLFVLQCDSDGQPLNWRTWFMRMGRGAGKTHGAATNVNLLARYLYPGCDGIMVGPDHKHVREVMIEGESGLIATAQPDFIPVYQPMYSRVVWPNGSKAMIYTSDNPQGIRGPSVHWGWGDELAKWKSEESYKNLLSTLRNKHEYGNRLILTTSPISSKRWIKAIESDPATITTIARTFANSAGLDAGALASYQRDVDTGSKRSREEYLGEWIEEGDKLWDAQDLDRLVAPAFQQTSLKDFADQQDKRLLSIDPGGKRDETGMVLIGKQGERYNVLGDYSKRVTKEVWEQTLIDIARNYMQDGDVVVIETNVHNDADADLRKLLAQYGLSMYVYGKHQKSGENKAYRAEKAHQLYEKGAVRHFRIFPELHQQMDEFYEVVNDKKRSPDRVDALAMGLNHLNDEVLAPFQLYQPGLNVRFGY